MRTISALLVFLAAPAWGADSILVVDRGLPQSNLNNIAAESRSNVRWANEENGFLGDDFTIGAPGEQWVIDSIRTWTVPGGANTPSSMHLGDFYQDLRLYFGASDNLTPISTAQFAAGTDTTDNSRISISEVTAGAGAQPYEEFGTNLRIYQIDFQQLSVPVTGGQKYRFGVWAMGRSVPKHEDKTFQWFNHASNAALSAAPQQGADDNMLEFDSGGRYQGSFDSKGTGWDKSADINVQVYAHRVSQ